MTDQPRLSERLRDARSAPMLAHFYAETARIIPELQALEAREERLTAAAIDALANIGWEHPALAALAAALAESRQEGLNDE